MTKRKGSRRSGKGRKERVLEVRVAFDRPVTIGGVTAPGIEPMQFFGPDGKPIIPTHIEVGIGYERTKPGLKVIQRGAAPPSAIERNPVRALLRFPTLLAIDTNTRVIAGVRVSVTGCAMIQQLRFDECEVGRWHANLAHQPAYEFHEAAASPELIGWQHMIERAMHSQIAGPVGVIVDSELGRISRFNRREEEIVEGFLLPDGYELIYASADRGTQEFVANAALSQCDRIATSILDRIDRDPSVWNWGASDSSPRWATRHRVWQKGP